MVEKRVRGPTPGAAAPLSRRVRRGYVSSGNGGRELVGAAKVVMRRNRPIDDGGAETVRAVHGEVKQGPLVCEDGTSEEAEGTGLLGEPPPTLRERVFEPPRL